MCIKAIPISINVYVRGDPSQRDVENKISELLLSMPREGEEGYCGWDVSSTSHPPTGEGPTTVQDQSKVFIRNCAHGSFPHGHCPECFNRW